MDNQRLLIWATFGLLLWMTYQAWVQDYGARPASGQPPVEQTEVRPPADNMRTPSLPSDAVDAPAMADEAPALEGVTSEASEDSAATIRIVTAVLDVEINKRGGTEQRARLLEYPVEKLSLIHI